MSSYVVSKAARRDMRAIWEYVARDRPTAADRLISRFEAIFSTAADFPGQGTLSDDLRSGLLRFPDGNYVIYYIRNNDGAEIVRVLHGARKVRRSMFGIRK